MWIMISGPYRSGAVNEPERTANLRAMNQAALALFRMGHIAVIGVNVALPVIEAAGAERVVDSVEALHFLLDARFPPPGVG